MGFAPLSNHPPIIPSSQLRSVENLEAACKTLEDQYEQCEQVKLDVGALHDNDIADPLAKEFLIFYGLKFKFPRQVKRTQN